MLRHVRVPVLQHHAPLGAVGIREHVADDDEPVRLEGGKDRPIQLALGVLRTDVVQGERRDDGVAAGKGILEPRVPELDAILVRRAPRAGDLEHVRVDVDELDAHVGERIEDRGRQRSGSRAQIDDAAARRDSVGEPMDNRPEHQLVIRDERPDRPVVVVRRDAEMPGDPVLRSHRPRLRLMGPARQARPSGVADFPVPGRLAQLGEHLPYKQGVAGSSPAPPIINPRCQHCTRPRHGAGVNVKRLTTTSIGSVSLGGRPW